MQEMQQLMPAFLLEHQLNTEELYTENKGCNEFFEASEVSELDESDGAIVAVTETNQHIAAADDGQRDLAFENGFPLTD